jgi:hypothetical protein
MPSHLDHEIGHWLAPEAGIASQIDPMTGEFIIAEAATAASGENDYKYVPVRRTTLDEGAPDYVDVVSVLEAWDQDEGGTNLFDDGGWEEF